MSAFYFKEHRRCAQCEKPSDGRLYGPMNADYGAHCEGCATKRIREERERGTGDRKKSR